MKIAIAQIRSCMGDLGAARARIGALSADAAAGGADLLVLPATALAPLEPLGAADCDGFLADVASTVKALAGELSCPVLLPVYLAGPDEPMVEVVFIKDGRVVPLRLLGKLRSMAAGVSGGRGAGEGAGDAADAADAAVHPALSQPLVDVAGVRLGVALTYEELDDYVAYDYPVDAVVFCTTYGFGLDDASSALGSSVSEGRFKDDADAMNAWLVAVGGVGFCGSEVFCGSSFVLAPWGELAAMAPSFEEGLFFADIDPKDEGPLKYPLAEPVFDPAITAWGALCEGLAGIVGSLGATDVSVVVDGRLAPMLACAVAVDALGPTHVHPVVLTCGDKAADDASRRLVRNLRLEAGELDASALGAGGDAELARDLAWVHAGASARAAGRVLLAAADKTSLALGTAPARDLACVLPFGDVYRSDVLALSRLRNTISPVIPASARGAFDVEEVVRGVRGSDESRVETLDFLLSGYIEYERPLSELAAECGDAELARNVVALVRKSLSELSGRVLAPTLSSKTAVEARGPLGLAWRDRVRSSEEMPDLESIMRALADGLASAASADGVDGVAVDGGDKAADDARAAESLAHEAMDLLSMLGEVEAEGGDDDGDDLGFLFGDGKDGGASRDGRGGQGGPFWGIDPFSDN